MGGNFSADLGTYSGARDQAMKNHERVYVGGTAGRNCHYRNPGRTVAAGNSSGAGSGAAQQCLNQLKQWSTAMHLYHDAKKRLPIGSTGPPLRVPRFPSANVGHVPLAVRRRNKSIERDVIA